MNSLYINLQYRILSYLDSIGQRRAACVCKIWHILLYRDPRYQTIVRWLMSHYTSLGLSADLNGIPLEAQLKLTQTILLGENHFDVKGRQLNGEFINKFISLNPDKSFCLLYELKDIQLQFVRPEFKSDCRNWDKKNEIFLLSGNTFPCKQIYRIVRSFLIMRDGSETFDLTLDNVLDTFKKAWISDGSILPDMPDSLVKLDETFQLACDNHTSILLNALGNDSASQNEIEHKLENAFNEMQEKNKVFLAHYCQWILPALNTKLTELYKRNELFILYQFSNARDVEFAQCTLDTIGKENLFPISMSGSIHLNKRGPDSVVGALTQCGYRFMAINPNQELCLNGQKIRRMDLVMQQEKNIFNQMPIEEKRRLFKENKLPVSFHYKLIQLSQQIMDYEVRQITKKRKFSA